MKEDGKFFVLIACAAMIIGTFMLLDWNWKATIGFALIKLGYGLGKSIEKIEKEDQP